MKKASSPLTPQTVRQRKSQSGRRSRSSFERSIQHAERGCGHRWNQCDFNIVDPSFPLQCREIQHLTTRHFASSLCSPSRATERPGSSTSQQPPRVIGSGCYRQDRWKASHGYHFARCAQATSHRSVPHRFVSLSLTELSSSSQLELTNSRTQLRSHFPERSIRDVHSVR